MTYERPSSACLGSKRQQDPAKYTIPLLFRHTSNVNNTEDYKQYVGPSEIAG